MAWKWVMKKELLSSYPFLFAWRNRYLGEIICRIILMSHLWPSSPPSWVMGQVWTWNGSFPSQLLYICASEREIWFCWWNSCWRASSPCRNPGKFRVCRGMVRSCGVFLSFFHYLYILVWKQTFRFLLVCLLCHWPWLWCLASHVIGTSFPSLHTPCIYGLIVHHNIIQSFQGELTNFGGLETYPLEILSDNIVSLWRLLGIVTWHLRENYHYSNTEERDGQVIHTVYVKKTGSICLCGEQRR